MIVHERADIAPRDPAIRDAIVADSHRRFVEPFRAVGPITAAMVDQRVEELSANSFLNQEPPRRQAPSGSSFLDQWLERRRADAAAQTSEPDTSTQSGAPDTSGFYLVTPASPTSPPIVFTESPASPDD